MSDSTNSKETEDESGMSRGAIIGIIVAVVIACCVITIVFLLLNRKTDGRGIGQARSARRISNFNVRTAQAEYNAPPLSNIVPSAPPLSALKGGYKIVKKWLNAFLG